MAYAEKRVARGKTYYRACYQRPDRKAQGYVVDEDGRAVRYPTKTTAQKAAEKAEAEAYEEAKRGRWIPPEQERAAAQVTFGEFAKEWLAEQGLADSTMQNYPRSLAHLLPTFGDKAIRDITGPMVAAWEKAKLKSGCAVSSVRTYRSLLHLILADAVDAGHAEKNVAERRRGRGRRHGRSQRRGPEKQITTMLGSLLIAERASLLSGRDDEFVAHIQKTYTGMRWGELVGLETEFARRESRCFRIEWQLYELDTGEFVRCPPKDDSYRNVDSPFWLSNLVADHVTRTKPQPCSCHGSTYVYSGRGVGGTRQAGPTLRQVAELAGVSTGTVSNVLNRPERVAEATRVRVEKAVAELGFVRQIGPSREAAHWRRSGHATWIFTPAATGWYPKKAPQDAHPVPVTGGAFPGVPVRGRGASGRAEACWMPIKDRLTRHGLRHGHRTLMEELGTPKVLMDDRMGHEDGSVGARYSHVTDTMRATLMDQLTEVWFESLDSRLLLHPRSPVAVLDRLLQERAASR
ncbi:putative LacI family transcriptional regulator [Actinacidiphila reveromycinica]|uniref:Putative LacI family transcriptional regulator n=1 Tax=Actinacidiphila reveromycinica TaxID=659352 RepID=A0A7U3UT42_9ACTN|nr:LacI family DNA-binding transcriptional regulator [Streptomyces sp. SN-593]BBA98261.1 putative LacI family transcriptional regulator [Streptomyces sp. SN-593]